ncbi:MAG: hypothetical protein ACYDDC_05565, partial [Thermoplasmataceae archaeon]
TFTESGLPSGTTWYVNVTNSTGHIFTGSALSGMAIVFNLTNASYQYFGATQGNEFDFIASQNNFSEFGNMINISINFFKPDGKLGANTVWIYVVIIGLILVSIILLLYRRKKGALYFKMGT